MFHQGVVDKVQLSRSVGLIRLANLESMAKTLDGKVLCDPCHACHALPPPLLFSACQKGVYESCLKKYISKTSPNALMSLVRGKDFEHGSNMFEHVRNSCWKVEAMRNNSNMFELSKLIIEMTNPY
jgi:hypothetical protein